MKRYALCGLLLLSLSGLHGFERAEADAHVTKNVKSSKLFFNQFVSSYFSALLASGFIGAATGSLVHYFEDQVVKKQQSALVSFLLTATGWLIESEVRNNFIADLESNLDAQQVEHKRGVMFKVAWLASWLAYLQQLN